MEEDGQSVASMGQGWKEKLGERFIEGRSQCGPYQDSEGRGNESQWLHTVASH
jgi:hypothetical protein